MLWMVLISVQALYASVQVQAKKVAILGEPYEFSVSARGFDVQFPKIEKIGGYWVREVKSEDELVIIGVTRGKQVTKHYRFTPQKDFTIPSFDIMIDGKHEITPAQHIQVKQATQSHFKDFTLQASLSHDNLYLGETTTLKLQFWYKDLEDYEVIPPRNDACFVQEISDKERKVATGYEDTVLYTLTPKKVGTFTIPAQKVQAKIKSNGKRHTLDIYSNPLNLTIHELPKDISLVGNYTLKVWTDATTSMRADPTILHVAITGEGNLENMDAIKVSIPQTTIFASDTQKTGNTYEKVFRILADEDFTIPALSLSFWDTKQKRVVTRHSEAIPIMIVDKLTKGLSMEEKIFYFLSGAMMMFFIRTLYTKAAFFRPKKKENLWIEKLKKTKNNTEFFSVAARMLGKDKALDRLIYRLEKCRGKEFKVLKKEILTRAKNL